MIGTFRLLVGDRVEQSSLSSTAPSLLAWFYIDKVGGVLGDALVCLDVGDNLIIVIKRFGADIMAAYLHGTNQHIHHQKHDSANEHCTPSSCEKLR